VSFSGGRDSSLVLCAAARLAAREGLPAPVPATLHFGDVEGTGEDAWQELVLRHLGLTERIVLSFSDELEALGPVATRLLGRFGVLCPPNLYLHVPLFEAATGGALLTGVGGDEVFDSAPSRLGLLRGRRARPRAHDLVRVGVVLTPRPLRERALRTRRRVTHPWLRPKARRWLTQLVAREEAAMPELWERALRTWWASRFVQASTRVFPAVAAAHDVAAIHPFLSPQFLSAMSVAGGPGGFLDRSDVLRRVFVDVLPPALADRRDKAVFDAAVWGPRVKAFTATWNGLGVDPDLVDVDLLRTSWSTGDRDYRTLLLLQTAWLAHSPRGSRDAR
jgi:asparagine synthase (glutamine-hydrolysing)